MVTRRPGALAQEAVPSSHSLPQADLTSHYLQQAKPSIHTCCQRPTGPTCITRLTDPGGQGGGAIPKNTKPVAQAAESNCLNTWPTRPKAIGLN
eukprot:365665-Chlamydomonas_euryale.AAC.11